MPRDAVFQGRFYCIKFVISGLAAVCKTDAREYIYSGPSILRPPMKIYKHSLIWQVVLKYRFNSMQNKFALWDQIRWSYNQGGLKIKGCKIVGPLYMYLSVVGSLTMYTMR